MEDKKKINLRNLLIPAIAVVLAAVLSAVIPILLNKETTPNHPTERDIFILNQLRPLLRENQLINTEYELFVGSNINKQRTKQILVKFDDLLQRKNILLDSLNSIEPLSYYLRVYQLLSESITSDIKLLDLQKSYIEKLKENSKMMAEVKNQRVLLEKKIPSMSDDELQVNALPVLKKMRDTLTLFQTWFDKNEAERKIARSNSIEAIRLLNEEIRTKNLPYIHSNVFEEVDPFGKSNL